MNIAEPVDIFAADDRTYRSALLKEFKLLHRGVPVEVAQIAEFLDDYVVLITDTQFSRTDCKGSIRFTTPGLDGELSLDLKDVSSIEQATQASSGCFGLLALLSVGLTSLLLLVLLLTQ